MKHALPIFPRGKKSAALWLAALLPGVVCLAPLTLAGAPAAGDRAAQKKTVIFQVAGQPKPGDCVDFSLQTFRETTHTLWLTGLDRKPGRRESMNAALAGRLTFQTPGSAELVISQLYAFVNGREQLFPELKGRTVRIEVRPDGQTPLLTLLPPPQSGPAAPEEAVLGGAAAAAPAPLELTPAARELLLLAFPSLDFSLSDLLGNTAEVQTGNSLKLDPAPLIALLRRRGLEANEHNIIVNANYAGQLRWETIPAQRIHLLAQGNGMAGSDFKLTATLLLPIQAPFPCPLRLTRETREVVKRQMPDENPLFAGSAIEQLRHEKTDIRLLPVAAPRR